MAIIANDREAFVSWAVAAGGELPDGYEPPKARPRIEDSADYRLGYATGLLREVLSGATDAHAIKAFVDAEAAR